jgi:hypothetical protein
MWIKTMFQMNSEPNLPKITTIAKITYQALLISGMLCAAIVYSIWMPTFAQKGIGQKFDRSEMILLNLTQGKNSAGQFLVEAINSNKTLIHKLELASSRVQAADSSYAKAKRRPDDRFLMSSQEKIKEALKTAKQLEAQLLDANKDLKFSVKSSLVLTDK